MASIEYYATGRRKTSTARVFLRPGTGAITVNHREFDRYFPTDALRTQVRRPLEGIFGADSITWRINREYVDNSCDIIQFRYNIHFLIR